MPQFNLVSIDPFKRTKIFYSAGFIVSGMTLLFFVYSSAHIGTAAANILSVMALVFFGIGAFLYWRAGKVYASGTVSISDQEWSFNLTDDVQQIQPSQISEIQVKDEGFQSLGFKKGKVITITCLSDQNKELKRFQVFFESEDELRSFLSPVKASGVKLSQH